MGSVSVQLGLLAIAKDWARADLKDVETATARATGAGHRVMVQQLVGDTEGAIRDTLRRWIDDREIDAIIVLGGAESEAVSAALKPLITAPLQGFSDLFRWLMFQEQGASAMLSSAEAARCSDTFVFVLPGAIGAAMDKLILPQFDPATTPKNLVDQMPRLRGDSGGVPQVIAPEKTQGGSGMPARIPAASAATRARKPSTGAHVIQRGKVPIDPETAPIDLERLEREIAATKGEDSTRKTDLASLLPKLPPGADGTDDDTKTDTLAAPPSPNRAPSSPIAPAPSPVRTDETTPGVPMVTINPRKRSEASKDAPTKPVDGPSGPTNATAIANAPTGPVVSRTSTGGKKPSPTMQAPVVPPPAKVSIPPMIAAKTIVSPPPAMPPDARARRASATLPPQAPSTRHKPSKPPPILAPAAIPTPAPGPAPARDDDDADTGVTHKPAPARKPPKVLTDVTVNATLESVQRNHSSGAMPLDVEDLETIDADAIEASPNKDDSPAEPPVPVKAGATLASKAKHTIDATAETTPVPKHASATAEANPTSNAKHADPNAKHANANAKYADANARHADANPEANPTSKATYADSNAKHADANARHADANPEANPTSKATYADSNAKHADANARHADLDAGADPASKAEHADANAKHADTNAKATPASTGKHADANAKATPASTGKHADANAKATPASTGKHADAKAEHADANAKHADANTKHPDSAPASKATPTADSTAEAASKVGTRPTSKAGTKPASKAETTSASKAGTKPASKAVAPTAATEVAINARAADGAPPRRDSGGLPRGTFNYPTQKRGMHPALKYAGFAAIAVAGFAAFVIIAGRDSKNTPPPDTSNPVVTTGSGTTATSIEPTGGSADIAANNAAAGSAASGSAGNAAAGSAGGSASGNAAAGSAEAGSTVAAATAGSASGAATTTTTAQATRPPTTRPTTTRPTTTPPTTTAPTTTPTQVATTTTAEPVKPEPVATDCDEQSCVMHNYDKPCCARFKPANDKPPVIATPVATSSNEPPEEVTRPMVLAAMNAVKARVTTCGEKNPAKGTVKIKVSVTPEGAVKETSVADSPDDALGACVAQALKAAKFGVTQKGGSFTYPFVF